MNQNIIFWGTPELAEIILNQLLEAKWPIIAVVTTPDKPRDRHKEPQPSPVKKLALKHGLAIWQPVDIKDPAFISMLKAARPNLMIVAAFGKIIPPTLLETAANGVINVHPSLLPKYRGASPVTAAILAGEAQTGVSLILMDRQMDHGPILSQEKQDIAATDTNITLHKKLAQLAAEMLVKTVPSYLAGEIKPTVQDDSQATYTKILTKADGQIDWRQLAIKIERQIRAYVPWPLSWTIIKKCPRPDLEAKKIIIHEASIDRASVPAASQEKQPGRLNLSGRQVTITTGSGELTIAKLQIEGGKIITAQKFLQGYASLDGTILV